MAQCTSFTRVGPYAPDRRLTGFARDIPLEGLPPVTDLLVNAFAVRCAVCAVPWVEVSKVHGQTVENNA